MTGGLMAAEMASQPEVLARLVARAPADTAAVRAVVPRPARRGRVPGPRVVGQRRGVRPVSGRAVRGPAGRPGRPSLYTRYHADVDWHGYLMIALSQSGATPEIISTCRAVRNAGATVIGITNEPGSPLAGAVDLVLATEAGAELAVPATKTVTAQFAALVTVAAALGTGPAVAGTRWRACPPRSTPPWPIPGPPGSWPGAGVPSTGWWWPGAGWATRRRWRPR